MTTATAVRSPGTPTLRQFFSSLQLSELCQICGACEPELRAVYLELQKAQRLMRITLAETSLLDTLDWYFRLQSEILRKQLQSAHEELKAQAKNGTLSPMQAGLLSALERASR